MLFKLLADDAHDLVADVLVRAEEATVDVHELDDAQRLERDEEELRVCRSFVQFVVSGGLSGTGKERGVDRGEKVKGKN
jgi:hypothetical protein